jgi:hypothetical protein
MKKIRLTLLALLLPIGISLAQIPIKEYVRIPLDQVPVAVRQAFEKDFGAIPDDGYWAAYVEKSSGSTLAKPLWYSYNKRGKDKVEVRFSPAGELTLVKGLNKKNEANGSNDSTVTDKSGT